MASTKRKTKKRPNFFTQLAQEGDGSNSKRKSSRKASRRKTHDAAAGQVSASPQMDPSIKEKKIAQVARKLAKSSAARTQTPAPRPGDVSPRCTNPIAAKFDVRNITSRELTQMGMALYQAGRISRENMAMLSFHPEFQSAYGSLDTSAPPCPKEEGPRDALAEWKKILETQTKYKSSLFFTDKTREIICLLSELDKARHGR